MEGILYLLEKYPMLKLKINSSWIKEVNKQKKKISLSNTKEDLKTKNMKSYKGKHLYI